MSTVHHLTVPMTGIAADRVSACKAEGFVPCGLMLLHPTKAIRVTIDLSGVSQVWSVDGAWRLMPKKEH